MIEIDGKTYNATIDEVISKLRLQALEKFDIDYFGDGLRSGNNMQYRCPFHKKGQEHSRSFGIRVDNGIWSCFTCGDGTGNAGGGDLYILISKILKISYVKAFRWLLENFVHVASRELPVIPAMHVAKKIDVIPEEEIKEYLSWEHPYMWESRHIDVRTQAFLEIGLDPKTLSIVFPMRDIKGRCRFIKKRPINPYNDARYINQVDVPKKEVMFGLWKIHDLKYNKKDQNFMKALDTKGIWIVEGEIDVASFWQIKVPSIGIGGKIFFKEFHKMLETSIHKHIIAFDNDEEGLKELKRVAQLYGSKYDYAFYPSWAKDMNDVIKEGKDLSVMQVVSGFDFMTLL